MSDIKKINKFTLISFILLVLSLVFIDPINLGICSQYDYDCDNVIAGISVPIGTFSFVFLVLIFLARKFDYLVINSWLRFSKYYLPIAAVLILLSPTTDSSILGFDKEFMTWVLAGIYLITSLGIIVFKRRTITQ